LTRILLGGALLVLWAPTGQAYVRSTTTKTLTRLGWIGSNCVFIRVNSAGSDDLTDGSAIRAAKQSMENWRLATSSCSYLRYQVLDDSASAVPGFNRDGPNENVVYWVEKGWTHDPSAAALTTVYFVDADQPGNPRDGQILDADVEINGVRFHFATTGAPDKTDVENTVTHELGHLMGLDHPCDDGLRQPVPQDSNGQTIPRCSPASDLPQSLRDSTMYNFADPGETKKRSPEADDIQGICDAYPTGKDPGRCVVPDVSPAEHGCGMVPAARGSGSRGVFFAALAVMGGLALRGRRRLRAARLRDRR
jgi:hypothetical protein